MRTFYLVAAIVGAVVPYLFFAQHFSSVGLGLGDFIGALFVNGAAGGFTSDLLITSFVFWAAMFERQRRGGPSPYLFVVLNLAIGLSCALPAYLYVREGQRG